MVSGHAHPFCLGMTEQEGPSILDHKAGQNTCLRYRPGQQHQAGKRSLTADFEVQLASAQLYGWRMGCLQTAEDWMLRAASMSTSSGSVHGEKGSV